MSTSPSEAQPSEALRVNARYFDGRTARAHPVTLALAGDKLLLRGDGIARADDIGALHVSEPMGAAPRLIKYPDGAHCEVRDHAGMAAMLAASHHRDSWVVHMQNRWRWAVGAIVCTVLVLLAAYRWGLPVAANAIAHRLPAGALDEMSQATLSVLDRGLVRPTQLTSERQSGITQAFARLVPPQGTDVRYTILFRRGGAIGANALALPDGTLIITDQLIDLSENDEEALAVLAHELGHVHHRHGLRQLIQGSILAIVVSWYLGDVGGLAAGLPTLLLQARYSREHEYDADAYAVSMLRANGISPRRLAAMLTKLEGTRRSGQAESDANPPPSPHGTMIRDYLSSHPATQERIEHLNSDVR